MNRAERRALGIKTTEPVINIKQSDLKQIKEDAVKEAVDKALFLMLAFPVMALHDNFAKYIKLKGEDTREARFCDDILELYDTFQKGYVSIEELRQCLIDEAGIDVSHLLEKKRGIRYV